MKIDITDAVRNEGDVFTKIYNGEMNSIEYSGENYVFPDGVRVNANYQFDGEGIVVTGSFGGEIRALCARCLKEVLYTVSFEFTEYYKKQQEDGYTYEGEIIDLGRMLEDNAVLSLPVKVLCRQECKGLCSVCGQNLNEDECSCKTKIDKKNPFYGLSKLYDDEEV